MECPKVTPGLRSSTSLTFWKGRKTAKFSEQVRLQFFFIEIKAILILQQFKGHEKLPIHGKAESWDRTDVERFMHKLLADKFLYEEFLITIEDMSAAYLRVGQDCQKIFSLDKVKIQKENLIESLIYLRSTNSWSRHLRTAQPLDLQLCRQGSMQTESFCWTSRPTAWKHCKMHFERLPFPWMWHLLLLLTIRYVIKPDG